MKSSTMAILEPTGSLFTICSSTAHSSSFVVDWQPDKHSLRVCRRKFARTLLAQFRIILGVGLKCVEVCFEYIYTVFFHLLLREERVGPVCCTFPVTFLRLFNGVTCLSHSLWQSKHTLEVGDANVSGRERLTVTDTGRMLVPMIHTTLITEIQAMG